LSISLPGDWETYLAGIDKKQRHEIRRKMRRAYSGELPVRWYHVEDPATLDSEIEGFLALMAQDEEKARFLTPAMRENFTLTMRGAFQQGYLFLAFLEIGGQKAAAYLNMDFANQLWVYNSGIDVSFNEYSPGWVLLGELLQWANEHKRAAFDFMRGDEDYKFRFGAVKRDVLRVTLTRG
jgi:CelD/BcsL family acetyltransferase involved in cellulose biosynthesis